VWEEKIPKQGRVAMERVVEKGRLVLRPAGEKNQNQWAAVWFVFGKERVLAERLCAGRMRSWLGLCGQRLVEMGEGEETHQVQAGAAWRRDRFRFPLFLFLLSKLPPSPL
jgi:hypothetical protein